MSGKKVLIVRNVSRESGGILLKILEMKNIEADIIDIGSVDAFPDPINYGAIFVFGGPQSANDLNPKIQKEIQWIKRIVAREIPFFGICLGLQLLAKSCNGGVLVHSMKEIGWMAPDKSYFEVSLEKSGESDMLFEGVQKNFKIFQLHGETVELGREMLLLGSGKFCKNQVVKIGRNAYGFQGHIELTLEMLDEWIAKEPELKKIGAASLRQDFELLQAEYELTAKQIFENFLKMAVKN